MGRDVTGAQKVLKWASFWQWGGAAFQDVAVLLTNPDSWRGARFPRLTRWKDPPRQREPAYVPDFGPRILSIDPATQAMAIEFRLFVPSECGDEVQIRGSFTRNRWRKMEDLDDGVHEYYCTKVRPRDWYEFRVRKKGCQWVVVTDPMAYRFAKRFNSDTKQFNSHALVPSIAYDMESSPPVPTHGLVICECTLPGLLRGLLPDVALTVDGEGPSIIARLLDCDVANKLRERGYTGVMFPIQASVANMWDYKWKLNYLVNGLGAIDAELGDWDEMKRLVDSFHAAGILVIPDLILVHHVKNSSTRGIENLRDTSGRSLWFDDNPFLFRDYGTWMLNLENAEIRSHLIEMVIRFVQELNLGAFRFDYVDGLVFQYSLGHRATSNSTTAAHAKVGASAHGSPGTANGPVGGASESSAAESRVTEDIGASSAASEALAEARSTRDVSRADDVDAQVARFVERTTAGRPRSLTAGEKLIEELVQTLDAYRCKAIRFSEAFSSRQVPSVRRMASVFYEPWVGVVAMSDLMNEKAFEDRTDISRTIAGVSGATAVHRPIDIMTYVMSHDEAAVDKHVMSARRRGGVGESAGGHLTELIGRFARKLHEVGKLNRGEMLDFVLRHSAMLESLAMFSGNFAHLQLNGASDAMQLGAYDDGWQFVWDAEHHPDLDKWVEQTGRSRADMIGILQEQSRRMTQLRRLFSEYTPLNADAPRGRMDIEVVGQWDHPASFAFLRTDPRQRVAPLLLVYNFGSRPISLFRTLIPALPEVRWSCEFAIPGRPDELGRLTPCVVSDGAMPHLQLVLPGHSMAIFREESVPSRS